MAVCARIALALAVILFPVVSLAYRFHIPTNLFTPDMKDASLPEGIREISWKGDSEDPQNSDDMKSSHLWSYDGKYRSRSRRAVPSASPDITESDLPPLPYDTTLYMYWPGHKIILLAKSKKSSQSSSVFLSSNFGKNWSKVNSKLNGGNTAIDQIYVSKVKPRLCILTDVKNNYIFITEDYNSYTKYGPLTWTPSYIAFHPENANRVLGYDKTKKLLYLSTNRGATFQQLSSSVRTFWWGIPGVDANNVVYVEKIKSIGASTKYTAVKIVDFKAGSLLLDNIDEFEVMKNYMFATQTLPSGKTNLKVSYNRTSFVDTKFPVTENNRDYFVFDVIDDQVFVVINHMKNESNMYLSDVGGVKFTLSLPRVLYHNPFTDVSSPWLRTVVPYAFVDVHKVKSMRGVYVATQLTPGPVGRRHLLSMITYNKGGSWKRIRSPTRDVNGMAIYCYLPSCSLHFNLKYGSVYRISPSEKLMSSESAPGLVMALGVASTNLKIHPDMFLSTDGGANWKRVLRGKHQYAFGNYGSVIVASYFRVYTDTLKFSTNGGDSWTRNKFTKTRILVHDIVTQNDEHHPEFLLYGTPNINQPWKVYHINMTNLLGRYCNESDFMNWVPSDKRAGFDRCILGRADNYTIRNWTHTCLQHKDSVILKQSTNCPCTGEDFECDFGFVRNASHRICRPVVGEDMDSDLIPDKCPEGSTYMRSSGYRKIPADTCVGGEEANFGPVSAPCPIRKLYGLKVTTTPNQDPIGLAVNSPITLKASLVKGYLPHVQFGWDFGDGVIQNGTGQTAVTVAHSYKVPGHYVIVLTVTNTRSILLKRIQVNVEGRLVDRNIAVFFFPEDPSVAQRVAFMANILGMTRKAAGRLSFTWKIDSKTVQTGWQAFYKDVFNVSKDYIVTVEVSNMISTITKTVAMTVSKDIRPINVKAITLGPTTVDVRWSPPLEPLSIITGYKVFRSTKRTSDYKECPAAVSSSATSYLVHSLTPSTRYYFKVLAVTKLSEGPFSDVASAVTNASDPGPPGDLRAYPLSSTSIRLEWKPPANDFGRITKYTVRWWGSQGSVTNQKTLDARQRRFDVVKLTQDTEYFFELTASFASGQSVAGPVSAKSNTSKPVLPPRGVKQVSNNGSCADLIWNAPLLTPGSIREFQAKGYNVYVTGKLKTQVSEKYIKLCGLSPGSTYTVEVSAYSVVGEGPKATIKIILISLKPSPPLNVRVFAMTSRKVKLQWDPPSSINGQLKSYSVYELKPNPWEKGLEVKGKTSTVITNLDPYTKYEFEVRVSNQVGDSSPSKKVTVMTHEEIPSAPKYIKAVVIEPESSTIQLSWGGPIDPNGKITGYEVVWGKTSIGDGRYAQNKQNIIGNKLKYVFRHLYSNTEYTFVVAAKNGAGRSLSYSNHTEQFTQPAIDGTKRVKITFQGKQDTARENFNSDFIKAVAQQANINPVRIAALDVKALVVEFDIAPNLKSDDTVVDQAIATLNTSFSVGKGQTVKGSARVLFTYIKSNTAPTAPNADALKNHPGERKSDKQNLTVIIVLTCVGLLLLAGLIFGMVFYYRKYKSLEKHYSNMSSIYRTPDDEANVIFPEDIVDEQNDKELLAREAKPKKSKKVHKNEEKMPLGDNDELAMV